MHPVKEQYTNIKAAINIVDIISHFEPLKKKGNTYVCKCPFHNEHTPSFTVNATKGLYHCFGCGAGGDAIKFVQEYKKIDFKAAMQWLADYYRLPLDDSMPPEYHQHRPPRLLPATAACELKPATCTLPLPSESCSYIPQDIFIASLRRYEQNNLVKFLHTLFAANVVEQLVLKYHIGTSTYYPGGCVFWQADEEGNVRTGKIMPYDPVTGKRNRQASPPANWAHTVLRAEDYRLQQCFFGQHLLNNTAGSEPVAIVESEKTALIASVFMPQYIWLASGGKSNLTAEKCACLKGRKVYLLPDLDAYDDWVQIAESLSPALNIGVHTALQTADTRHHLPEKSDLCDYLISIYAKQEWVGCFKNTAIADAQWGFDAFIQTCVYYHDRGLTREDRVRVCEELVKSGVYEG